MHHIIRSQQSQRGSLWIAPDDGPNQPKPEAIVLNSICFQQQYEMPAEDEVRHLSAFAGHAVSNIRSDLTRPKLIG
jgi:hypothetical protein